MWTASESVTAKRPVILGSRSHGEEGDSRLGWPSAAAPHVLNHVLAGERRTSWRARPAAPGTPRLPAPGRGCRGPSRRRRRPGTGRAGDGPGGSIASGTPQPPRYRAGSTGPTWRSSSPSTRGWSCPSGKRTLRRLLAEGSVAPVRTRRPARHRSRRERLAREGQMMQTDGSRRCHVPGGRGRFRYGGRRTALMWSRLDRSRRNPNSTGSRITARDADAHRPGRRHALRCGPDLDVV